MVFQVFTNCLAWSISLFHSSTDHWPTPAVGTAEVAVEVGADLVALQPRQAHLPGGVGDALLVVEADVRTARRVLRRPVQVALVLGQHVHTAEEERHLGVVVLGHLAEVREQLLAVLARAVPGEDDELRGGFSPGLSRSGLGICGWAPV